MKTKFNLLSIVFLLLSSGLLAQFDYPDVEDYGIANEVNLGYPDTDEGVQFIPIGIDLWEGDDVNTIYYGKVPANSSDKPVMVFVHGYATNASVWFKGDDNMYWDVYRDGYRSAFVSLTPNRHMWTNGNMLANMLSQITSHYGVDKVVLVGWSKGAVDVDAALVHSSAHTKVSQVFTLSGAHFGTGIAELANNVLLSLVNIIFMQNNDATVCLKRGYMNYFRSITDGHANNTIHYTTLGAWGNGPLNRLIIPQGYLYLAGGSKASGGNDGVVPYSGSRRPGGTELFGGQRKEYLLGFIPYYTGPDETNLDHYEITRGSKAWPHIRANLTNQNNAQVTAVNYNPNAVVSSKMQIVTGKAGETPFMVEENAGKVTILMAGKTQAVQYEIRNEQGNIVKQNITGSEHLRNDATTATYELEAAKSGKYTIKSDEEFAAIIMTEGGIELQLNTGLTDNKLVYESGESINLELLLNLANGPSNEDAIVTGTMTRTVDLKLRPVEDMPQIITFNKVGNSFKAKIDEDLPAGIYTITVNAQGKSFMKNVITSIAVVGTSNKPLANNNTISIDNIYPNPAHDKLTLHIMTGDRSAELIVYNMYGQKVKEFSLVNKKGKTEIEWNINNDKLKPGLYILQLTSGNEKATEKIMIE